MFLQYLLDICDDFEFLSRIYEQPSCCAAVLRVLPPLAQQWVARLAFLPHPMPLQVLRGWCTQPESSEYADSLHVLLKLKILVFGEGDDDDAKNVQLSSRFKPALQTALTRGSYSVSALDRMVNLKTKQHKSVDELNAKACERWECLLKYLALPGEQQSSSSSAKQQQRDIVSDSIKAVMDFAGFTKRDTGRSGEVEITSSGFQFLLMDRTTQVWTYVVHWLRYLKLRNPTELVHFIHLLLRLSFCSVAVPYRTDPDWNIASADGDDDEGADSNQGAASGSSNAIQEFMQHLRELGLIFMRKRKDGYFFVTPLMEHLSAASSSSSSSSSSTTTTTSSSSSSSSSNSADEGFLIVETNYRVYAYTQSTLQLAILSTFCDMLYRFGNMSVGVLTRESVRRALQVGITAKQIIGYLRSHVHCESLRHGVQPVPVTVCDQVRLWELERERLQFSDAVLFSGFDSHSQYEKLRDFTVGEGINLWKSDSEMVAISTEEGYAKVKAWFKQDRT